METETPAAEPEVSTELTDAVSEGVLAVAGTAIALAEGQAALATQQAAEIVAEHSEAVAEVVAQTEEQDRSIEALWREQDNNRTLLLQMQETLGDLSLRLPLTPQPSPEEAAAIVAAEVVDPEAMIEPSIPQSTSELTSETETEHSGESVSVVAVPDNGAPVVRRFNFL